MTASDGPDTLEAALADLDQAAEAAERAARTLGAEAKRLRTAAQTGDLRDIRKRIDGLDKLGVEAEEAVSAAADAWTFEAERHLAGGGYAKEVLARAHDAGVQVDELDGLLISYPAVVRILPGEQAVQIDKRKDRKLRPSRLVAELARLQQQGAKQKSEAFLQALATAYDLVVAKTGASPGATVRLVDVYAVLTVLPSAKRDYDKTEFARDLYLLEQSGVIDAKDGRRLELPASALTRGSGNLTTVTKQGQVKIYAGIKLSASGVSS